MDARGLQRRSEPQPDHQLACLVHCCVPPLRPPLQGGTCVRSALIPVRAVTARPHAPAPGAAGCRRRRGTRPPVPGTSARCWQSRSSSRPPSPAPCSRRARSKPRPAPLPARPPAWCGVVGIVAVTVAGHMGWTRWWGWGCEGRRVRGGCRGGGRGWGVGLGVCVCRWGAGVGARHKWSAVVHRICIPALC